MKLRKYGITTVDDLRKLKMDDFDAIVISTPPDKHSVYIALAIKHSKPAFVEASVVLGDLEKLNRAAARRKSLLRRHVPPIPSFDSNNKRACSWWKIWEGYEL